LATVHGIVKHLGGHVTVDTAVGRGTTFRVYVPALAEGARVAAPKPPRTVARDGHETVVVCEDDAMVRQLVCGTLAEHGYRVVETAEAKHAIALVGGHGGPIDLLITDVVMAGMNGLELARVLQQRCPQMKVLFISGYPSEVIARHGVLDPGIEFLAKPFRSGDLLQRVREVLEGRPAESAP
jgi:DNA-binding response OmpR family regulator